MTDDFSYVRTAQVLAQTGHIVFNGWGAPMVGWQLLPAALLIKLFGFSFAAVRSTTLLIAMMTAFLFQRTLVRAGINEWNATAGTLTLVLSPMYLGLSFLFLTDMWCLFALVFCLYACLRALQAQTATQAVIWLWVAALGGALFGTVRQVGFLGVLVMVPCTFWLLRKTKGILLPGIAACATGYAIVFWALHWFGEQPFTVAIPLRPSLRPVIHMIPNVFLRPALETAMLILPILLMFLPAVRFVSGRARIALAGSCLVVISAVLYLYHRGILSTWGVPFVVRFGSILSRRGFFTTWPTSRTLNPVWPHIGLPEGARMLVALATVAGLLCLLVSYTLPKRAVIMAHSKVSLPLWKLNVLVVPTLLAYLLALIPTGFINATLDRYLLPLVAFVLILLVRHYQETVRPRLPAAALLLASAIGIITVPALHDLFALYRTTLAATSELQAAGIPRSHIDAGFEYNGWTQITEGRFVHFDGVRLPSGITADRSVRDNICPIEDVNWFPKVQPDYSLSFDEHACGGPSTFAPVVWHRWISPRKMAIYIVKNPIVPGYHLCWVPTFHQDPATMELLSQGCDPK